MLEQDLEFIYQSLMPRTKIQISYLGDMLGCKLKSCPCGSGLKYKNCHGKYKS